MIAPNSKKVTDVLVDTLVAAGVKNNHLALKAAALKLGAVTEEEFDRVVDPAKMVKPYVAIGKK
jgi:hypothetical protein